MLRRPVPWHDRGVGVVAIDHVQLAMPAGEEATAIAFYEGLLGIPNVPKPPHLATRGGCWFEEASLKVHLGVEQDFHPARKAHPALRVIDLIAEARSRTRRRPATRAGRRECRIRGGRTA
jgi:hypothetical protein